MKMDPKILNRWKKLYSKGDIGKIAAESNIHRNTISAALSKGEVANFTTLDAIALYYKKKQALLNQYS